MARIKGKKPSGGKKIKAPDTPEKTPDQKHPTFSFRHLVSNTCDAQQLNVFVEKLKTICGIKWRDWKLARRQGFGYEKIAKSDINIGIPGAISADVQHFLSFRIPNGRVIGYRSDIVFYIIWMDGKFEVYNH